jgi:PAS domain S-box-containing protein
MSSGDDFRRRAGEEAETQPTEAPRQPPAADDAFRHIVERLPIPLAIIRLSDGKILFTNRCLDNLFGVEAESLWNRDWSFLIPGIRDRRRLNKLLLADGSVRGEEVRGQQRDGTRLWFSVWQERLVCNGTECVITVLVNVTRQRSSEAEQRQRADMLQKIVDLSERDRELIACEIHDGVIQDMTGALMQLEAARLAMEEQKPDAAEKLQTVSQLLRDGVQEARRLIDGVSPPDFESLGLLGALQRLINRFSETEDLRVNFYYDVPVARLGNRAETAIYRIVQEALHNVRRHSKSKEARVVVTQQAGKLELMIRDEGIGFDVNAQESDPEHFGLTGIRQRTRMLGGTCTIESAPEKGTTIRVVLPVDGDVAAVRK